MKDLLDQLVEAILTMGFGEVRTAKLLTQYRDLSDSSYAELAAAVSARGYDMPSKSHAYRLMATYRRWRHLPEERMAKIGLTKLNLIRYVDDAKEEEWLKIAETSTADDLKRRIYTATNSPLDAPSTFKNVKIEINVYNELLDAKKYFEDSVGVVEMGITSFLEFWGVAIKSLKPETLEVIWKELHGEA